MRDLKMLQRGRGRAHTRALSLLTIKNMCETRTENPIMSGVSAPTYLFARSRPTSAAADTVKTRRLVPTTSPRKGAHRLPPQLEKSAGLTAFAAPLTR